MIHSPKIILSLLLCCLCGVSRAQDVRLTEFLATNVNGIVDEDSTHQGWIEIWNPSTSGVVVLSSWKLKVGTTTWTFPNVQIPPDERMIIWASGKNRVVATAPLHTNFTIPAAGGTLDLLRGDSSIASRISNFPAQQPDVSFGRDEWDFATTPTQVGFYTSPTPGERNNYAGSGVAGNVIINQPSKAFSTSTLSVTLSQATPDPGAAIRYTTNGAVPLATSTLYSTPLTFTSTTILRARVFKTGLLPGETETQGYLRLDSTTSGFSSAMPIVVLSNNSQGVPPDTTDQTAFIWTWQPAGTDNRARFTDPPTLASRAVVDRRGSSTLNNEKTNLNLEMRKSRDDDDRDVTFLGLPEHSDFVLSGPFDFDRSEVHNPFIYALSNNIGRYAPATRLAEVFMDFNGGALNAPNGNSSDYFGIYNVIEKIRRDKNRVNIEKLGPYDNDAVSKTGGYIWKVDRLDSGDTGFMAGNQSMAYYYPKELDIKTPQRDPQEQYLTSYINSFNAVLQTGTWNNPTTGYAAFLDVPAAIDHHLLNVWPMNVDGLRLSGYWHKDRGGKLVPGPIWDFDRAMFSATDTRTDNPASWRATVSDYGTDFFNYVWWNRLFLDIDFYQKYIDRWQSLRRGAFSQANVNALLDSLNAQMSAEAINRDLARWGKTKRNWSSPFNGQSFTGQAAEIQRVKDWLQQRANFMDSQWVGPVTSSVPAGSVTPGTQVILTGPTASTIRYTLNGTDPRPTGGGNAPGTVLTYTTGTPITINATTRLRARAYKASWLSNGAVLVGTDNPPLRSAWSGETDVRFSIEPPAAAGNLIVSEINYHPSDPTAGELAINSAFTEKDFEFIELKNISAAAIDLSGGNFANGVSFTFSGNNAITLAPGAFVIVAGNPAGFAARYGSGFTVVGPWLDDLANGGEQITLRAANNAIIVDFAFNDSWYSQTDGNGYTLAVYDSLASNAAFGNKANWRGSVSLKGSPGADEPNRAPTANAGPNISGNLSALTLTGSGTDDRLPNPPNALTYAWSQFSGPGTIDFNAPTSATTGVSFSLPGIYIVRLTVSDSLLTASHETLAYAKDAPAAWLARHPGIGALDDDPDKDGRSNFVEFATMLDPSLPDMAAGPVATLENGRLSLTYNRIKPPCSVVYQYEVADEAVAFRVANAGEVTEQILADSGTTQTVKATDTVTTSGQQTRFLRLKVSPAP